MIRLDRVTKIFGGSTQPRRRASSRWTSPRARSSAWSGPSGCGKTTTLKMINRLVEPTSGTDRGRRAGTIRSVPPHELRRGIGYVIQQVGLFAHRTVAENIATVPTPARLGQGPDRGPRRAS